MAALAALVVVLIGCAGSETPGDGGAEGDDLDDRTVATPEEQAIGPSGGAGAPGCLDGGRDAIGGFGVVALRVVAADGGVVDACAHLASTPEQRAQGLMGQQDLGGYDAMVFRFDEPTTGSFYMFETVLPLSIAFIDAEGAFVSATDMAPCPEPEPSACRTYPPAGPYLHAVEVVEGDLRRLGVGPGATVSVGDPLTP